MIISGLISHGADEEANEHPNISKDECIESIDSSSSSSTSIIFPTSKAKETSTLDASQTMTKNNSKIGNSIYLQRNTHNQEFQSERRCSVSRGTSPINTISPNHANDNQNLTTVQPTPLTNSYLVTRRELVRQSPLEDDEGSSKTPSPRTSTYSLQKFSSISMSSVSSSASSLKRFEGKDSADEMSIDSLEVPRPSHHRSVIVTQL